MSRLTLPTIFVLAAVGAVLVTVPLEQWARYRHEMKIDGEEETMPIKFVALGSIGAILYSLATHVLCKHYSRKSMFVDTDDDDEQEEEEKANRTDENKVISTHNSPRWIGGLYLCEIFYGVQPSCLVYLDYYGSYGRLTHQNWRFQDQETESEDPTPSINTDQDETGQEEDGKDESNQDRHNDLFKRTWTLVGEVLRPMIRQELQRALHPNPDEETKSESPPIASLASESPPIATLASETTAYKGPTLRKRKNVTD